MNLVASREECFEVLNGRNVQRIADVSHFKADRAEDALHGAAVTVGDSLKDVGDVHLSGCPTILPNCPKVAERLDGGFGGGDDDRNRSFVAPAVSHPLLFFANHEIFHDKAKNRRVGEAGAVQPPSRGVGIPQLDDSQQNHRRIDDAQLDFFVGHPESAVVHTLNALWKLLHDLENSLWHCSTLSVVSKFTPKY